MHALKESVNAAATLRPATGNGSVLVNGRGIRQRKLSREQAVALAADLATGEKPFRPSLTQACSAVNNVPVTAVRAEIKRRAAATNGNGGAETLTAMAAELVDRLGLDGALDLLIAATER
jgi:hypothetical protein